MPKMFKVMDNGMHGCARDNQREKLYRAERAVRAEHGGQKFETVEEMQAYIDNLIKQKWFQQTWPRVIHRVTVCPGYGHRRATCSWCYGWNRCPVIQMPKWARCEQVLLHELAHALTPTQAAPHGWEFTKAFLRLVRNRIGRDAEKALRESFRKHRVRMSPKRKRVVSEEQKEVLRQRLAAARARRVETLQQVEAENG